MMKREMNRQVETSFYASLEYTFKVADPLICTLYDGGFLRKGDFKLSSGEGDEGWHDNWGLGIRIMVMGMPLTAGSWFPSFLIQVNRVAQPNSLLGWYKVLKYCCHLLP